MRTVLYCLVNANFLRPVQHGIQAAHAMNELHLKYAYKDHPIFKHWAEKGKTMCILDGGSCGDLHTWEINLRKQKDFLWASFREDKESLNNALTCVCLLVDKQVHHYDPETGQGYILIEDLRNLRLAR